MPSFGPGDLDILSRAFYRAIDSLPSDGRDPEESKAILMTGILDAARQGERDEEKLTASALAAIETYEDGTMDAVMQTSPL
jgi:hypothetical protein